MSIMQPPRGVGFEEAQELFPRHEETRKLLDRFLPMRLPGWTPASTA